MSHPSSLLSCLFLSVSLRHPSLSTPMDYQTNFYHYTLQVKKKEPWAAPHTAPFDFYVAPTGSSIIAPPGTPVHRDPDEMLSWHRYQSPYACPSPVPDVQEGGMCCNGRSPLFLPVFSLSAMAAPNNHSHSSLEMAHFGAYVLYPGPSWPHSPPRVFLPDL